MSMPIYVYLLVAVQSLLLVCLLFTMFAVKMRIVRDCKIATGQTHEMMDNVLQRLIPLEIGKEMNRIALEVLFNEDEAEPENEIA